MTRATRTHWILLVSLAACAHGAPPSTRSPATAAPAPSPGPRPHVAAANSRPYTVRIPNGYDGTAAPLVLALHARGGSGAELVASWQLDALADAKRFLLVAPDGTTSSGSTFWNATDACCDFDKTGVDDVAYLARVLDEVATAYAVDAKRIYVVGYSNGAAMAHRLACDDSERIAAVLSLEGAGWKDAARCRPKSRVALVEVHGTADEVVAYDGGGPVAPQMNVYPGVVEEMTAWAARDGCTGSLASTGHPAHFVANLAANETDLARFSGCPAGGDVEVWTVHGGPHFPALTPAWGEAVWAFLAANPKP